MADYLAQRVARDGVHHPPLPWSFVCNQVLGHERLEFRHQALGAVGRHTNATNLSPQRTDGAPTTAASDTPACERNTSSTSRGYTLKPPVMMSSFVRPLMRR